MTCCSRWTGATSPTCAGWRAARTPPAGCGCCARSTPGLADDDPFGGEVPDPYGGHPGEYARAFELIHAAAKGLAQRLAEFLGAQPAGR